MNDKATHYTEPILMHLANWVSLPKIDIPAEVLQRARLAILDTVGTSVGARMSPEFDQVSSLIDQGAGRSGHRLIGRQGQASLSDAAMINAFTAHLLDFDDSHGDMAGHPTAVVFPALLAVATDTDAMMSDVVRSYVVGVEVISRLGRLLNPDHYDIGWHPTATVGVFGAAAATAHLLGLSKAQTQASLSLAAAFSSGIKASFGTSAKPLQVGRAAASGLQATLLASAGATGRADAFEHHQGYLAVFERKNAAELAHLLDHENRGSSWSLMHPGIIIKQYPCCGSTHSAIESASALSPIRAEDIAEVVVRLHAKRRSHVDRPKPSTALEAKFSVQYTVARALTKGSVTLTDFTDSAILDPEILALVDKVTVEDIVARDTSVEDRYVASVTVRLHDGTDVNKTTRIAAGRAPGEMLSAERIVEKFTACVDPYLRPDQTSALLDLVTGVVDQRVRDLVPLTQSL